LNPDPIRIRIRIRIRNPEKIFTLGAQERDNLRRQLSDLRSTCEYQEARMEENCGGSGGYNGARPPWERRSLRKKRTEKQRRPPLEENSAKEGNLNKVIFFFISHASKEEF
jgi:hypothetical protein